jgi:hypothetical protein
MAQPQLVTYYDCVQVALDFLAGNNTTAGQRDIRRAIHEAYRELGEAFGWSFLHKQGRVQLSALYSTGTVGYNSTTRVLTIASGSWPSWAQDATVRVGDIPCRVQTRTNSTSLVLDSMMNPGKVVATGTSHQIYPTCYTLPHDFLSMVQPWGEESWRTAKSVSYDRILALDRYRQTSGSIRRFCVREVADLHGSLGLYIHPPSDAAQTLDFIYQRRGRALRYTGHDATERAGTISVTAAGVVTGTETSFDSTYMPGAVVRIGVDGTNNPTGLDGLYPYSDERIVASVASSTSLTLDGTTTARTDVKYVITDPVDIDLSLANCLYAGIRQYLASGRNFKNKGEYIELYDKELGRARQNDQRVLQPVVAGGGTPTRRRWGSVPHAADLE